MSEVKIITPNLRGASVIAQNRVHMLFRLTGRSRHLPTLRTTEITDGPEQLRMDHKIDGAYPRP